MSKYSSFEQLNGKTLKKDDDVQFGILEYTVQDSFLNTQGCNEQIFQDLGMTDKQKELFLNKMYGYKNSGGQWNTCKIGDYEALTRAVLGIFAMIEGATHIQFKNKKRIQLCNRPKVLLQEESIGGYSVSISPDAIIVGCTGIPFKRVESIYKKMLAARK